MIEMSKLEKLVEAAGDFRRRVLHWWTTEELSRMLKIERADTINASGQRSRVLLDTDFTYMEDKIVQHTWNYELLTSYSMYHPFLSLVHGKIINRVIKRRIIPVPNFAKKCTACGNEHKSAVEECTKCGSTSLREPNDTEKELMKALLERPNRQDETRQIRESYLRDCLSTGNAYLHKSIPYGNIVELWNEQSPYMFVATDERAILGNDRYFCINCTESPGEYGDGNSHDQTISEEEAISFNYICPICGDKLQETSYIYKRGNHLTRYSKKEIMHFNSDPRLPNPYGWSKVISILLQLRSGIAMDKFNYDNYHLVRMAKMIVYEKTSQNEANKLAEAIQQEEVKLQNQSQQTGIWRKIQRTLHLGAKGKVNVYDAMPDPASMQSLDWYDYWLVRIVAPQYGVTPVFMNASSTKGSDIKGSKLDIVVNDDTVELWCTFEADTWNSELLPDLHIYDWKFGHEPLHPKEKRDVALTMSDELKVLEQAARLGIKAIKDEDGNLTWSGEVDLEVYKLFAGPSPTATQVSSSPSTDENPQEEGDENLVPGETGSGYKPER